MAERWTFDYRAVVRELGPLRSGPICGATTRSGQPCRQEPVMDGDRPRNGRCHWHGGKSTGPTSAAGRAAIAESNQRRR